MKAVGYVRVSRVGGREGDSFLSPALQREQIAAVAKREGLDVVEVIEELDASGGDAARPGWNRAIGMVERGEVAGIAVWNWSRFSRSVKDALEALGRVEAAGGRVYSATEPLDDGPMGVFTRNMLLSMAQMERDRATVGFHASKVSAMDRGIHVAGTIPVGYRRDADRRLVPDPDKAPIVQGVFERRAEGLNWHALARWASEQGHDCTDKGVEYMTRNRVYLGEIRNGSEVREGAHEAIVSRGLFARCQGRGLQSERTGRLAGKFLLGGIASCASCGRGLRLTSGGRKGVEFYICRNRHCDAKAYANARRLDDFVLNAIDERINAADPGHWVARPGGGKREVADAEADAAEARADLDGFLLDTTLRRVLGPDKYAGAAANYVTVLNAAEQALAEAREASSGSYDLVGRLWNTEWGHAERTEWLRKMAASVVVTKGREPLSGRVEIELR